VRARFVVELLRLMQVKDGPESGDRGGERGAGVSDPLRVALVVVSHVTNGSVAHLGCDRVVMLK
jgi:hypothetical protein